MKAERAVHELQVNRRTVIAMPQPILGSLRWPNRPKLPAGNPCWTYMVESQHEQFAVAVGHVDDGKPHAFEVWVLGTEQPRGLGAVAKTLSADMRAEDAAWLGMKLAALEGIAGSLAIDQPLGEARLLASSHSAALARVVQYRIRQLDDGDATGGHATPLVDAMLQVRDAGHEGTLSWTADIKNPQTGDDFMVFLPEVETEQGVHRPVSVKLAGRYPRELDGLAALLTLDMAVVDVAWIGMKLRKLLDYDEPMGSFFAKVPGTGVSERFPSIVAYLARLILHRFTMLGLLTASGYPVVEMGVMVSGTGESSRVIPVAA